MAGLADKGAQKPATVTVGIVTGLAKESVIARKLAGGKVACAAAVPQNARWLSRKLIADEGATRLLSFGICGALEPGLPPGSLIIGSQVVARTGKWDADATWLRELMEKLPAAHIGPVWGAERIAGTLAAKRHLYQSTQCLAVDTESHCVAQAAQEARVPFAVVRAVCDTAEQPLPSAALVPLRADGAPDLPGIFRDLLRRPGQLRALIALARASNRAFKALGTLTSI